MPDAMLRATMGRRRSLRRRLRPVWVAAIALLCAWTVALAAEEPCRDQKPVLKAEQACRYYKRQDADVRDAARCCLPKVHKAAKKQDRALEENAKAHDLSLPQAERSKHLEKANDLFAQRSRLAEKFTKCVNEIKHALDEQKVRHTDPRPVVSAQCGRPYTFVENLGWRPCVDLARSPYLVDQRIVEGGFLHEFNCHYYTKLFISTLDLDSEWFHPGPDSVNECIKRADQPGFIRTPGMVHVGDIVLIEGPGAIFAGCDYHHSGFVTEVNGNLPKTIRSKDGPTSCVVDLSWEEFKQVWLNREGQHLHIRSNPQHSGNIPSVP